MYRTSIGGVLPILVAATHLAVGQVHFKPVAGTGDNATIGIAVTARPAIDGTPLAPGDEIAAFTSSGLCVGATVWRDSNTALAVWGDNIITPEVDGMADGDTITFRVWSVVNDAEYTDVDVTYLVGNGVYAPNGVYQIATMDAEGSCSVAIDSFVVSRSIDGNVHVAWITAEEGETEQFEVERSENALTGFAALPGSALAPHPGTAERCLYEYVDSAPVAGVSYYRIAVTFVNGTKSVTVGRSIEVATGLAASPSPGGYTLEQNFPNPFNPATVISGQWPVTSVVRLVVYDAIGREVAVLAEGQYAAGRHSFTFDAGSLASGIYFCRMSAGPFTQVKAMVLER